MKWTYSIKNKLSAAALLAVVLGLVFLNNIDERLNADKLRSAIATMYEDRLVVEGYILDLTEKVHDINESIENGKDYGTIQQSIADIRAINDAYAKTVLTKDEEMEFVAYTTTIDKLESSIATANVPESMLLLDKSLSSLYNLSDIQLAEANRVKKGSDHILNYSKTSSQFEMAILIVIFIVIQVLVLASPAMQNFKNVNAPSLN